MANKSGTLEMRKMIIDKFGGKHYLTPPEVAPLFGVEKAGFYHGLKKGYIALPYRKLTQRQIRITLGDLLDFLYPLSDEEGKAKEEEGETKERRKPGRPRRSATI